MRSVKLWLLFVFLGGMVLIIFVKKNWNKYPMISYRMEINMSVDETWVNHGRVLLNDSIYAPDLSRLMNFPEKYAQDNFGLPKNVDYRNIRISIAHIKHPYILKKDANSTEYILIKEKDTLHFTFPKN